MTLTGSLPGCREELTRPLVTVPGICSGDPSVRYRERMGDRRYAAEAFRKFRQFIGRLEFRIGNLRGYKFRMDALSNVAV